MRYYLPGEDHKPQSSVQGENPAKKKEAEARTWDFVDCIQNDKRKDI